MKLVQIQAYLLFQGDLKPTKVIKHFDSVILYVTSTYNLELFQNLFTVEKEDNKNEVVGKALHLFER